jgi:pyruvate/2-oxoglutarate dehydrogenase complex dihydrolipoamide acyltransferase (E2) component
MLEKGDVIAEITIGGVAHSLCVNFPCGLSALVAPEGNTIKTGERVAVCAAEGEDISYGKDYLYIRAG